MCIFRKTNVPTRLYKNGHNSTCDQYFFMKLAPLDSAHIELLIHAKNSKLPFHIVGHIFADLHIMPINTLCLFWGFIFHS